jgi:hypothetical protein
MEITRRPNNISLSNRGFIEGILLALVFMLLIISFLAPQFKDQLDDLLAGLTPGATTPFPTATRAPTPTLGANITPTRTPTPNPTTGSQTTNTPTPTRDQQPGSVASNTPTPTRPAGTTNTPSPTTANPSPVPTSPPGGSGGGNPPTYALKTTCTHTYSASGFSGANIPKGSVICVNAGTYSNLKINDLVGTRAEPITIINKGGQVVISGGSGFGIDFNNNKFFRLTGMGASGVEYGFKVQGGFSQGVRVDDGSNEYELDHIEITGVGIGLGSKTKSEGKGGCSGFTQQNFTQTNTVIHNLYIHNVSSEAMYVGSNFTVHASSGQGTSSCPSELNPVLKGLWIYDNKVESFGKDGINVKGTPENCNVYNNEVNNGSTNHDSTQCGGIAQVLNTSCNTHDNTVTNQWGPGIQDNGKGGNTISKNTLNGIQGPGIQVQNSTPGGTTVIITGNTITGANPDYQLGSRGQLR